jgi:hypothetical protein
MKVFKETVQMFTKAFASFLFWLWIPGEPDRLHAAPAGLPIPK